MGLGAADGSAGEAGPARASSVASAAILSPATFDEPVSDGDLRRNLGALLALSPENQALFETFAGGPTYAKLESAPAPYDWSDAAWTRTRNSFNALAPATQTALGAEVTLAVAGPQSRQDVVVDRHRSERLPVQGQCGARPGPHFVPTQVIPEQAQIAGELGSCGAIGSRGQYAAGALEVRVFPQIERARLGVLPLIDLDGAIVLVHVPIEPVKLPQPVGKQEQEPDVVPLDGRDHVIPEDIQNVLPPVAGHRLHTTSREGGKALHGQELVAQLIGAVKLP